jgi:type II secretion system protein N
MKFIPNKVTIKSAAKYILIGSTVFAVGMVWNFPYERIRDTLTGTLTRRTGYRFDMEKLSLAIPLGFEAEKARVQGPPFGGQPVDLTFDSLRATVNPFSLLGYVFTKSVTVSYAALQEKTRWKGSIGFGKEDASADLATKDWKLKQTIPLGDLNQVMAGSEAKVAATIALTAGMSGKFMALRVGDLSNATGDISLGLTGVTIDAPLVKQLRFDKIQIEGKLEKGKLNVKSITLAGPDITGTANGTINVSPYFPNSQLDLDAKLTLTDKVTELRTLISTMGAPLGLRVNEQGVTAFKVSGAMSSLDRMIVRGY